MNIFWKDMQKDTSYPNGRSSQAKMVSIEPALPNKTIKSVGQTIRYFKLSQKFSDIPESLNIA